jgi:hypothetical protein
MATIHRNPSLPDNIVEFDLSSAAKAHRWYEAGHLLVLRGVRIDADFEFLAGMRVRGEEDKHKKFILTHPQHYPLERNRDSVWRDFKSRAFPLGWLERKRYRYFQSQVLSVNTQIAEIARRVFPRYRTSSQMIAWKFQEIRGENLHVDNIDQCERWARLRAFVNLGRSERIWAISHHVSKLAADHFDDAGLKRFAGQPYEFNRTLSAVAFGKSQGAALSSYPRHYVYFEPGEVWFLNSMVSAHQVLYGNRAAIATFPFSYDDYEYPEQALPRIVDRICLSRAGSSTSRG